jgi:hypothetical protein
MKFLIQTQPPYNLYQKFNSMISTPKKVWFHLSQWFQRGLIMNVYRGQRMSSCSNTSHDHYYIHRSCVPDLCRTTR